MLEKRYTSAARSATISRRRVSAPSACSGGAPTAGLGSPRGARSGGGDRFPGPAAPLPPTGMEPFPGAGYNGSHGGRQRVQASLVGDSDELLKEERVAVRSFDDLLSQPGAVRLHLGQGGDEEP